MQKKLKKYSATVREKESREFLFIENKEYSSLKKFKSDLRANGFIVYKNRIACSDIYEERFIK